MLKYYGKSYFTIRTQEFFNHVCCIELKQASQYLVLYKVKHRDAQTYPRFMWITPIIDIATEMDIAISGWCPKGGLKNVGVTFFL